MTVREVFENAISLANEKRNDWVHVTRIQELEHCYLTNSGVTDDNISFTMFFRNADIISLIRPISDRVGISLDSAFIYADAIKVVDMQTQKEFIITKDGIR